MKSKTLFKVSSILAITIMLSGLLALGQSYAEDCQEARTYFDQAYKMEHQPGDMKALMEKERLYRKALELCPSYAQAHNNLGDVYENLGKYAEAIEEYMKAKELRSDRPDPYYGLGDVYSKNGSYEEAIKWYDAGLKLDPKKDRVSKELRQQAEALLNRKGGVIPENTIVQFFSRPQEIITRGPGEPIKLTFGSNSGEDDTVKGLIPFDYNKDEIRDDARPQLNELGRALSSPQLLRYVFEIGGHTDIRGSDAYNLDLSLKRAKAVKDYLENRFHIPEERLRINGYGKSRLIALGTDEASHAINRRVEIVRLGEVGKVSQKPVSILANSKISLDVGFLYRDGGTVRQISSDGTTVLRTIQNPYQIFIRPHQSCYVYLLQRDSAGKWYSLAPRKDSDFNKNPVEPGKDYWVPKFDEGFPLDNTRGEETIYLLASLWKLPELESAGPRLEEVVIPITRSFQTRGLSHIGRIMVGPLPGVSQDYGPIIENFEGNGGFIRTISFIHQ